MLTATKELTARLLEAAKQPGAAAVDGPLVGAKIALFVGGIAVDDETTLADLEEATYGGYARSSVIVWGEPFVSSDQGQFVMPGDAKTFTSTGSDPEQTVSTYGIVSADTPAVLLAVENLEEPEEMSAGAVKILLPRVALSTMMPTPAGVEALT